MSTETITNQFITREQHKSGLQAAKNYTDQQVSGISVPAYDLVKDASSGDYAAVYHLTKDGANVGVPINIPKDMVVQSGSVVENPEGQTEGTYIKLVLQNVTDPLYINVGSLIEYVTSGSAAGDMIFVTVDPTTHKVTATITDGTITLAKLTTEVQEKIGQAHEHANKTELDKIAEGDKEKWDNAAAAVTTLVGSDANKSARAIAGEVVAAAAADDTEVAADITAIFNSTT